jgi:putative colanic acid biosynthesis UDP-glucose lipid carrier transferase
MANFTIHTAFSTVSGKREKLYIKTINLRDMVQDTIPDNPNRRRRTSGSQLVKGAIFISDFLLLNLLFFLFEFVWNKFIPQALDQYTRITLVVMNFSMLIAEYFFHTIVQRRLVKFSSIASNTFKLVLTQAFITFLVLKFVVSPRSALSFPVVFTTVELMVIIASRMVQRWLLKQLRLHGRNSQTVLLVGNDPSLLQLYHNLTMSGTVGYRVLGYYADGVISHAPEALKWRGNIDDLNRMLDHWNNDPLHEIMINEVFCSLPHEMGPEVRRIMDACDRNVIRFYYVPRVFREFNVQMEPIKFGDSIVFTNRLQPLSKFTNRVIKRTFDICVSLLVLIFLIPLTLIVGIIIKIQSPGPIFFKQKRTGLDGHAFYCYKFRSMHVNRDSDSVQATKNDPRKFAFGNFMRKSNIDELPQFFNVFRGDMSIVGPRPHMLLHTEMYGKLIDKYMVRHFYRPGITGWAQVTGFRGETEELWQMEERVKRDIWYIENWSLWLDLKIMWMTAKSVFIHDEHAY